MTWRNQTRDLGILFSLVDDLQVFWQCKNIRWDALHKKIEQAVEHAHPQGADPDKINEKFRAALKNDADYRELRHRIIHQRKETKKICTFLGLDYPQELLRLKFTQLLIENEVIEDAVDVLERLIPLCRVSSYPYHWVLAAARQPLQFFKDLREFLQS